VWSALRALCSEPGLERRSEPSWWARGLVLAFAVAAVAEGLLREGLAMRPLQIAFGVTLAGTLWFRRTNPLSATAVAFGLSIAVSMGELLLGGPKFSSYTGDPPAPAPVAPRHRAGALTGGVDDGARRTPTSSRSSWTR
jgi:hypothetical protein